MASTSGVAKADDFLGNYRNLIAAMTAKSLELKDQKQYQPILDRLASECNEAFKYSSTDVYAFGSRPMGIATDQSDLDIYIVLEGSFNLPFVRDDAFDKRFKILVNQLLDNVQFIFKETKFFDRIPNCTFQHFTTEINCNINISNGLGYCNSKMLQHLFALQPEAVSLFHFFRQFLKEQGFQYFHSYPLALLVVFYLQLEGFMPTIEVVQLDVQPVDVGGWPAQLNSRQTLKHYGIYKQLSYQDHIVDIFKFYKEHDFDKIICVYDGSLADPVDYLQVHPEFELEGIRIAGPINKKRNCGVCDRTNRDKFLKLMRTSADHLVKALQ